ncbi:hypothetical protein [Winogradskya humida]|uniref:hypothetical protein n=1 Tax=Winogradskya humida TaxID=113566 RepID=UPI0019441D33|nr:hypothetical protein [Actinoplanes humidus]
MPEPTDEREGISADPITPDEHRIDESLKEDALGARYEQQKFFDVTANDPAMFGNNNTQNNFGAQQPQMTVGRPPNAAELAKWYEPTGCEEQLRHLLEGNTTVCLTGEPGTGRFSTACHVLVGRHGADRLAEIFPPPDRGIVDAVHEFPPEKLKPGRAYILRIHDEDPAPIMDRLNALVSAKKSKLLLIRDLTGRARAMESAEVRHRLPSPIGVFRMHARRELENTSRDPEAYVQLAQSAALLVGPPREVAEQVTLALRYPAGPECLRALREQSQQVLLARALNILDPKGQDGPAGRRRLRQHRRAFQLSYAALRNESIDRVFAATGLLLSQVDAESGWDDLGRTALEHSVEALLGDVLAADWSADQVSGGPRLARLDPRMAGALFSVAWHEFDHTRPAIIAWLNALVESPDAASRRAATAVTVNLALLDFDRVDTDLISVWSASQKVRVRRAAAQVVVYLSAANDLDQRMLRTVHRWVDGAANLRRDTAAWAYVSGLRQNSASWNLADLRRIAEDPMQRSTSTIAEAVGQIFDEESYGLIVATLAGWIRADGPQRLVTRHAARALIRIAGVPARNGRGGVPLLLLALSDAGTEELAVLWYAALLGASTKREAWHVLLGWLRSADREPELRKPVVELLHEMARVSALRRRLHPFLSRPDAPDWIADVVGEWNDDRQPG